MVCSSVRGPVHLWVEEELEDDLDRSQGGPCSEDREVGLTAGGVSVQTSQRDGGAPAKAVMYTGGGGIEEAAQEALMNEKLGPEWASLPA